VAQSVTKLVKVLSRIVNSRRSGRSDGYVAANTSVTNDTDAATTTIASAAVLDDVFLSADELERESKMALPPRYRFRDLLLGDFAFTDDGQR